MSRTFFHSCLIAFLCFFATMPRTEAASLRSTMKKHESEFRACFQEEATHLKKRVSGRVNLHITVDKKGRVVEVTPAKNTTHSRAVADCLVRRVEGLSFGKRKTNREIFIYPIKFSTAKP